MEGLIRSREEREEEEFREGYAAIVEVSENARTESNASGLRIRPGGGKERTRSHLVREKRLAREYWDGSEPW